MEIALNNIKKVALLGTNFTMEKDFYKSYLLNNSGIEVIIPTFDTTSIHAEKAVEWA